jgi:hypothetical protein
MVIKNKQIAIVLIIIGLLLVGTYTGVFNLAINPVLPGAQIPTSVTFNTIPGGVSINAYWYKGNGEHGHFGTQVSTEGDTGTTTFSFNLPQTSQILFCYEVSKTGYNSLSGSGFTKAGDQIIQNITLTVKEDLKSVQSNPLTYLNKWIMVEGTCSGTQISDGKGTIAYKYTETLVGKQSLTGIYKKSGSQYYLEVTFASSKSPEPSSLGDFTATFKFSTFPAGATVNAYLWDYSVTRPMLPEGYPDYGDNDLGFPILDVFQGTTPCTWNVHITDGQSLYGMFTTIACWTIEKEGYSTVTMPDVENGTWLYGKPVWNNMVVKINEWLHRTNSFEVMSLRFAPQVFLNKVVTISGTCLSGKITDSTGSIPIQYSSSLTGSYTVTGTFVYSSGGYRINVQTITKY